MTQKIRFLDRLRRSGTEYESSLIEGAFQGRVSRRELLRYGSVLGMSLTTLRRISLTTGLGAATMIRPASAAPGGSLKIASGTPSTAIDPVIVPDSYGLAMLQQTGEYLAIDGADLVLRPCLATSWSPNATGSVWTFKIRTGVKFHNGVALTAKDVAASINRLADPKNKSNALSALRGVLSPGGAVATDVETVEFHLDAPNGNFPYIVSSDNYNAIIIPADYAGDWEKTFIGTGPFKLEKYTPKVGASFVRNPDYWGAKALPDRTEFTFYTDIQPQILALQGGDVDIIRQVPVLAALPILNDPKLNVISIGSAAHQQVHMRCDTGPFADKRVRQALALTLDREKIIQGLLRGRAKVGNDSPFAALFPSTDNAVPQRKQDLAKAKQLLEAAGVGKGFKTTLTTETYLEIPQYAQLIQSAAKQVGIEIDLKIEDAGAYYGDAVFGKSDWLDSTLGITDFGHRGVPNVFLAAPLLSDGTWNAAHFKNAEYDGLVKSYVGALDLDAQRAQSGKIESLLLDETPIIFGYFYDYLSVTGKSVAGVEANAMGHIFLDKATKG
jgi:peptide/nickel transport system substrate-binding protein